MHALLQVEDAIRASVLSSCGRALPPAAVATAALAAVSAIRKADAALSLGGEKAASVATLAAECLAADAAGLTADDWGGTIRPLLEAVEMAHSDPAVRLLATLVRAVVEHLPPSHPIFGSQD